MENQNKAQPTRKLSFRTLPNGILPAYAIKSRAPWIAAAMLESRAESLVEARIGGSGMMSEGDGGPFSDLIENLYLDTFRAILSREQWEPSTLGCCLPFVDLTLDALTMTTSDLLLRTDDSGRGLESQQEVFRRFFPMYIKCLVEFGFTAGEDLRACRDQTSSSSKLRGRGLMNASLPCRHAAEHVPMPVTDAGSDLETTIDEAGGVARAIGELSFFRKARTPMLVSKTVLCGARPSRKQVAEQARPSDRRRAQRNADVLMLDGDSGERNVLFRHDRIEHELGARLSPMARDLIEVATYLYVADVLVRRSARWRRRLTLHVPVRHPQRWRACSAELELITSFVSGDHIELELVQRTADEPESEPLPGLSELPAEARADCVCLFSGGLDSLAGSLHLARQGRRPVLVSHFRQGQLAFRQSTLAQAVSESSRRHLGRADLDDLLHLRLDSGLAPSREDRHGLGGKLEYTQRLRSFLYLSLASATAEALGLDEVYIPENGILAWNIPLAACRTGSRSTRSAHPRFLWGFQRLVRRLFDSGLEIKNPFAFKTKAEVLQGVRQAASQVPFDQSVSCSRYFYGVMMERRRMLTLGKHVPDASHCGGCLACHVRRAAMVSAGLADQDASYLVEPFRGPDQLKAEERLGLLHLVELCTELRNASKDELLTRYPQLILPDRYFDHIPGSGLALTEAVSLYRRFADEILEVCPPDLVQ